MTQRMSAWQTNLNPLCGTFEFHLNPGGGHLPTTVTYDVIVTWLHSHFNGTIFAQRNLSGQY